MAMTQSSSTDLSSLSNDHDDELVATASSWCASHGVLMGRSSQDYVYEPAPFSLHPSPFPRSAFEKSYRLGKPFNRIVHAIADQYQDWLRPTIRVAAEGDEEFTGKLMKLADSVVDTKRVQNVALGLLRSDYMLHQDTHGDINTDPYPLQVELNTIASSFACLSSKISKLHQFLDRQHTHTENNDLPDNPAATNIADGLAAALHQYVRQSSAMMTTTQSTPTQQSFQPVILMIVQPGETNSCDQRDLEFLLHKRHGLRMIRRSLHDIATTGTYNAENDSVFQGKELVLPEQQGGKSTMVTAAVVYFRAGYTPNDYPSQVEWEGRAFIEHSAAIKCPDVFYHLVGTKVSRNRIE